MPKLMKMSQANKIRFAVMINGRSLRSWQKACIDQLLTHSSCELVSYISNPDHEIEKKANFFQKIFRKKALYNFLLNRIFRIPEDKLINISSKAPLITCKPELKAKYSEYFNEKDLFEIKTLNCDFILRFGYNIIRGEILDIPKYGIWSFHHGDERKFRGGPPAFWEIWKKEKTCGLIFQKLNDKLDAGSVLIRREYITVFHSYREMRQKLLNNTDIPLLALIKYIEYNEPIPESQATKAKIYHLPSSLLTFIFLHKLFFLRISFHFKRLFQFEKWSIIYNEIAENKNIKLDDLKYLFKSFKHLKSSDKSSFLADVFILEKENKPTLIFENFSYKEGIANISILDNNQKINHLLKFNRHLSYPYVFKDKNCTWIIPEDASSGKCFAYKWDGNQIDKMAIKLIDKALVDPSFIFHNDLYYMFCGIHDQEPNEKLFCFYSEKFEGPYKSHALNPVKVTPYGSRSGGSMFFMDNNLIRPSQVSVKYYGEKLYLNKIKKLSPTEFNEEKILELSPNLIDDNYSGLHNISISNGMWAMDVKKHRWGFKAFKFKYRN